MITVNFKNTLHMSQVTRPKSPHYGVTWDTINYLKKL